MRRYLALARLTGGPGLLAGSLLVAPGQAAVDLVILLALRRTTGSFAPGGIAVAAATIAYSISAITQGRLTDRIGIRRVIGGAALAMAAATAALAGALALEAPAVVLIALSAVLGLSQPATTPAIRTAWLSATEDPDAQTTAFSYAAVVQDLGYVAGPAGFGLLATAATPTIALACCSGLTATGALTISAASSPPVVLDRVRSVRLASPLRTVALLGATMAAIGAALATVDVSAPALAIQDGRPALAGLLLAACFLGSLLGGLAYGARAWRSFTTHRLLGCTSLFASLLVLPAVAPSLATRTIALLICGTPMGATLATAYLLAGELLPAGRMTLGFSLLNLALNLGGAAGYAVGAQIAARHAATEGFLLGAGTAGLAALGATALSVADPKRRLPTATRDR